MMEFYVAPFAGAWIEMQMLSALFQFCKSLPSRERGLKWHLLTMSSRKHRSLPSRERGLKFRSRRPANSTRRRSLRGSVD